MAEANPQGEKLTGVVSAKQLQEVLAENNKKMAESFVEAIGELGEKLKEPTKAEARKMRQEELLLKRAAEARKQEAKLSIEDREAVVAKCRAAGHNIYKPGGGVQHAFRGNLNSDGCIRAQCIACHVQLPPFKAPDAIKAGSSVNEWFLKLPQLTEAILVGWSKETNPEWWAAEEKKAAERKAFLETFRGEMEAVNA
jgi:hypothetical protein